MKKFEELSIKTQTDVFTWVKFTKLIIGIVILSIGLSDIFFEGKGSFWSILYSIIGFIMIFGFQYKYKDFLETKKLERDLDIDKK